MAAKRGRHVRVHPKVTYDDDGGLTIHDVQSNLVVSIIGTHPDASGPRGLHIEVYDYNGREVLMEDAVQMRDGRTNGDMARGGGLRLVIAKHPTIAFYPDNRSLAESEARNMSHVAHDEVDTRMKR